MLPEAMPALCECVSRNRKPLKHTSGYSAADDGHEAGARSCGSLGHLVSVDGTRKRKLAPEALYQSSAFFRGGLGV